MTESFRGRTASGTYQSAPSATTSTTIRAGEARNVTGELRAPPAQSSSAEAKLSRNIPLPGTGAPSAFAGFDDVPLPTHVREPMPAAPIAPTDREVRVQSQARPVATTKTFEEAAIPMPGTGAPSAMTGITAAPSSPAVSATGHFRGGINIPGESDNAAWRLEREAEEMRERAQRVFERARERTDDAASRVREDARAAADRVREVEEAAKARIKQDASSLRESFDRQQTTASRHLHRATGTGSSSLMSGTGSSSSASRVADTDIARASGTGTMTGMTTTDTGGAKTAS